MHIPIPPDIRYLSHARQGYPPVVQILFQTSGKIFLVLLLSTQKSLRTLGQPLHTPTHVNRMLELFLRVNRAATMESMTIHARCHLHGHIAVVLTGFLSFLLWCRAVSTCSTPRIPPPLCFQRTVARKLNRSIGFYVFHVVREVDRPSSRLFS